MKDNKASTNSAQEYDVRIGSTMVDLSIKRDFDHISDDCRNLINFMKTALLSREEKLRTCARRTTLVDVDSSEGEGESEGESATSASWWSVKESETPKLREGRGVEADKPLRIRSQLDKVSKRKAARCVGKKGGEASTTRAKRRQSPLKRRSESKPTLKLPRLTASPRSREERALRLLEEERSSKAADCSLPPIEPRATGRAAAEGEGEGEGKGKGRQARAAQLASRSSTHLDPPLGPRPSTRLVTNPSSPFPPLAPRPSTRVLTRFVPRPTAGAVPRPSSPLGPRPYSHTTPRPATFVVTQPSVHLVRGAAGSRPGPRPVSKALPPSTPSPRPSPLRAPRLPPLPRASRPSRPSAPLQKHWR